MTKERLSEARRTLAHFIEQLAPLVEELARREPLLKGYVDTKPRTCGKPGCRCATGKKHQAWVLRIPEGSGSRSRSIPEAVYRQLEPLVEEYRRFRKAAVRWRQLVRSADAAIRQIESARIVEPEAELKRMKNGN
jgi:hypothetical protein